MVICPSCRRAIDEEEPWLCPYCDQVLGPDLLRADEVDPDTMLSSEGLYALSDVETFSELEVGGGEPAEALIVGAIDDVLDAPTVTPVLKKRGGKVKSYLFYAPAGAPVSSQAGELVYPTEMTADDLGEGIDPEHLGAVTPVPSPAIEEDTLKINIPSKAPAPAPAAAPLPPPRPALPEMDARSKKLYEQAEQEVARGDFGAAIRNLKLALTFDARNREIKDRLDEVARIAPKEKKGPAKISPTNSLYERATEKEAAGDIDGAIELLEKALKHSKDASVFNRLGVILAIRKKDYQRGREMVEYALELAPDNEVYRNNLSKILAHAATMDLKKPKSPGAGGGIFGIFGKKK